MKKKLLPCAALMAACLAAVHADQARKSRAMEQYLVTIGRTCN